MLYLSRYIGTDNFGVVDTDDGHETVCSYKEVLSAVSECKLDIAGAEKLKRFAYVGYIRPVQPAQPDSLLSKLQVKTSVLLHTDVCVYRGSIASLVTANYDIKEPVEIRLSDFGDGCWDGFLRGNKWWGHHRVTLIFDDKIHLTDLSLYLSVNDDAHSLGVDGAGFMFDLREVTRQGLIQNVYESLWCHNHIETPNSIIDTPSRMKTMFRRLSGSSEV